MKNKHKFKRLQQQWSTDGPSTAADVANWCSQLLSRLSSCQRQALKQGLRSAWGCSTAYSGIGFFEHIVLSLTQNLGIRMVPCREAWEINSRARTALLGKGLDSPQHLFGDLLGIFPRNVVAKM